MAELKFSIFNYIAHFGIYDYIAYIWLILTFLILVFLSLLLAKKSTKMSVVMILFAFILLFVGPFVLKYFLDKTVRPVLVNHVVYKKLHFSNTLIVDYSLKNLSKKPYYFCQIDTKVYKPSKSKLRNFLNKLKPITYRTIINKKEIKAGESMQGRTLFYDFSYPKDINVSVEAKCYGGRR